MFSDPDREILLPLRPVHGRDDRAQRGLAALSALSADQTRNLNADEVREQKLKLSLAGILNVDKFGIKKNLLGMERLNGRAAYRLELSMPNGKRIIQLANYDDTDNAGGVPEAARTPVVKPGSGRKLATAGAAGFETSITYRPVLIVTQA